MKADFLRVAASVRRTRALGPGQRFAVWLQGCPFSCPGCLAPEFLPLEGGYLMDASVLAAQINATHGIEGVTISGGEPLLQVDGLAEMLAQLSAGLSVIVFTGYDSAELARLGKHRSSLRDVLGRIDVLIDGRYQHADNDSLGLRGSRNQTVHFLTLRYRHLRNQFESGSRRVEVHESEDMLVGIPPLAQWKDWVFGSQPP
jgi:anaerobic ribonucleoside-triphosphate reductase activating protein